MYGYSVKTPLASILCVLAVLSFVMYSIQVFDYGMVIALG